jgi:hypothetical protein
MPVRTVHLTFDDVFEGAYAGWWADCQTNVTLRVMDMLGSSDWQRRREALSTIVRAWNWVDPLGVDLDPADPEVWNEEVPTDLLRALSEKFNTAFEAATALPLVSPPPSKNTQSTNT